MGPRKCKRVQLTMSLTKVKGGEQKNVAKIELANTKAWL